MDSTNVNLRVSIHAPTKGATSCCSFDFAFTVVSIHAPTKGATGHGRGTCIRVYVSIHAPTKGATLSWVYILNLLGGFNPRTHKGCDIEWSYECVTNKKFQSTHPQRVRLCVCILVSCFCLFQSTHPQRVRLRLHIK